jgi:hypothetical protein
MAYHTASTTPVPCPRCNGNVDGYACHCGIQCPYGFPFIEFDSGSAGVKGTVYRVVFNTDEEETEIKWTEYRMVQQVDVDASIDMIEKLYGKMTKEVYNSLSNAEMTAMQNKCRVYRMAQRASNQSITIKSLRWKITIQDIQKLMLLK